MQLHQTGVAIYVSLCGRHTKKEEHSQVKNQPVLDWGVIFVMFLQLAMIIATIAFLYQNAEMVSPCQSWPVSLHLEKSPDSGSPIATAQQHGGDPTLALGEGSS